MSRGETERSRLVAIPFAAVSILAQNAFSFGNAERLAQFKRTGASPYVPSATQTGPRLTHVMNSLVILVVARMRQLKSLPTIGYLSAH